MRKNDYRPNFLRISQTDYKNIVSDSLKTTDINILLNRVRTSKKIESKKRVIFSLLLILFVSSVAIFFGFK